jgi:hypothetical protein
MQLVCPSGIAVSAHDSLHNSNASHHTCARAYRSAMICAISISCLICPATLCVAEQIRSGRILNSFKSSRSILTLLMNHQEQQNKVRKYVSFMHAHTAPALYTTTLSLLRKPFPARLRSLSSNRSPLLCSCDMNA